MSAITWTETIPSSTSYVVDAPDYLHSLWTSISVGLSESIYWDGVGGSSTASRGELHMGASRLYTGASYSSSSFDGSVKQTGRGFYFSGGAAFAYDSSGTITLGAVQLEEYGVSHSTSQWRELSGVTMVSNATFFACRTVSVLTSLEASFVTWGVPLVTSSNASVFARPVLNYNGSGTSLSIEYLLGDSGATSVATFSWTLVGASKVVL